MRSTRLGVGSRAVTEQLRPGGLAPHGATPRRFPFGQIGPETPCTRQESGVRVQDRRVWLESPLDRTDHSKGVLDGLIANPARSKQLDAQKAIVVHDQQPVAALVAIRVTESSSGLNRHRAIGHKSRR